MEEGASESATAAGVDGPATVSAPDVPATDAPVPLERDWACHHCGYNLRGLKADGQCPECGRLIADTMRLSLCRQDVAWLARLRRGLLILAIAESCTFIVTLIGLPIALLGFLFPRVFLLAMATFMDWFVPVVEVVRFVGIWFFTSSQSPRYPSLNLKLSALVLRSLTLVLLLGVLWRYGPVASLVDTAVQDALSVPLQIVATLTGFFGYFALCWLAGRLAKACGQLRLSRCFHFVGWWYPVLLIAWILMEVGPSLIFATHPSPKSLFYQVEIAGIWTVTIFFSAGSFLTCLALVIFMMRLRRALARWP